MTSITKKHHSLHARQSRGDFIFDISVNVIGVIVMLIVLIPLIFVLAASFSDPDLVLRGKVLLAEVNDKGIAGAAGGRWTNGRVEGRLRSFGRYCIVADTVPPGIVPSFKSGADLSATATLSFTIGDNLSGIDRYEVLIDGQWALFEYDPKNRRITHRFAHSPVKATGGVHTIEATVTDGVGNVARYKGRFVR